MSSSPSYNRFDRSYWKRMAIFWGVLLTAIVVIFLLTWNSFFDYVPAGKHLVIVSKGGSALNPGEVLAEPGQKGPQREVRGEGWHFVMPIAYSTDVEDNTVIPPGKIGLVTARGGTPLDPGQILADEERHQQGIQRRVLTPGAYRINRHGYEVQVVPATEIKPGYVGVQRRLVGSEGKGLFAAAPGEKGYLKEVLQPGIYYLNPKEIEVIPAEVGIFQTTFHNNPKQGEKTPITFTSRGGFAISADCTVEWEVLPQDMPTLVAEYGSRRKVEENVIDLQTHAIGRDKGSDYGIQDFLEGAKRKKFQDDFTQELIAVCKAKNVTVHSAFVRNIDLPPTYLKEIQDRQISHETRLTNKFKEATAQSETDVRREQATIDLELKKVQAETARMVAVIDNQVEVVQNTLLADLEKLRAEYQAKIQTLESDRERVLGEAKAQGKEMKETARSSLFQLKMEAFQNDGNAFLRYSLAEKLNPDLRLRLFHTGTGTFWTNLDGKGMNLMLSPPIGSDKKPTPEKK